MGFLDRLKVASPPEWRPDPTGHHEHRLWDGRHWTDQVADGGVVSTEIVKESMAYTVTRAASSPDELTSVDFHDLPYEERPWCDAEAYCDPERFARSFGSVTLPTEGLRVWQVVGEEPRQDAIGAIAGPKAYEGAWTERVAELRPEPDNPYDGNAIAVDIDGQHVGYLPRREAATHRRLIDRAIAQQGRATCGAVINGGWRRPEGDPEGSEGFFGVRLYFGYANTRATHEDLPAPTADEERIPYVITDDGHDHITVTGEENHQDAITTSLGDGWAGDHPFRLLELRLGKDPKGRPGVAIGLDRQLVGWLTPKMAERFRPAVEATRAKGRRLTACATLQPSKRKGCEDEIDIVLRVPRGWGA